MSATPVLAQPELRATPCAICGVEGESTERYPANFDLASLNPDVFSARRLPDRIHFRIVQCDRCGLLRSDPVADTSILETLYRKSAFNYSAEVSDLRRTYGAYLAKAGRHAPGREDFLEIGCGNGFFLEEARRLGYRSVRGVEPSESAIAGADPALQGKIVCDVMRPGIFAEAAFDVVCVFQVFDHIPDPVALLKECLRILRPGGVLLAINHNASAVSARLLGESSPIIDIEHTYLYNPDTMRRIFSKCGFEIREAGPVFNRYALRYLVRLLPLPSGLKSRLLAWLQRSAIGALRCVVPLGNLYSIARKPLDATR